MKLYNTMSRQKEQFIPLEEGKVKMYVCGPTVYNFIHIGNARPVCVFDTMRRYLEYKGYEVTFVQNFTDVDDKIIMRANEEGVSSDQIAEKYIGEFLTDTAGLGVRPPTIAPRATKAMAEIIELIDEIIKNGFGYESNGDVYFRAIKFANYGKLSGQNLEELEVGARVSASEIKQDPLDFTLWKASKPDEPSWNSPWGKGRPGWHIECSAMVRKYLGQNIDIHAGGRDLIFPHHENEIAQSECSGHHHGHYAKYWAHNGYINIDNQKMSKSLGNFFTVRDVAEKYGYESIKYLLLQAHYRSPMNYNTEIITQCKNSLERLHNCRDNMDFALGKVDGASPEAADDMFLKKLDQRRIQFETAMDDDLNTADALAAMFDMVRDINIHLEAVHSRSDIEAAIEVFDTLCDVLGILYNRGGNEINSEISALIDEREIARSEKNYKRSDEIRDQLLSMGVTLKDTPQGVKYTINK